jgi:hypothetical protein
LTEFSEVRQNFGSLLIWYVVVGLGG